MSRCVPMHAAAVVSSTLASCSNASDLPPQTPHVGSKYACSRPRSETSFCSCVAVQCVSHHAPLAQPRRSTAHVLDGSCACTLGCITATRGRRRGQRGPSSHHDPDGPRGHDRVPHGKQPKAGRLPRYRRQRAGELARAKQHAQGYAVCCLPALLIRVGVQELTPLAHIGRGSHPRPAVHATSAAGHCVDAGHLDVGAAAHRAPQYAGLDHPLCRHGGHAAHHVLRPGIRAVSRTPASLYIRCTLPVHPLCTIPTYSVQYISGTHDDDDEARPRATARACASLVIFSARRCSSTDSRCDWMRPRRR